MKKIILIAMLWLVSLGHTLQAQNKLFDTCAEFPSVSSSYISTSLFGFAMLKKSKGDMADIFAKIEGIYVTNTDDEESIALVKTEVKSFTKGCEELLRIKEEDSNVVIYIKELKKEKKTCYVLVTEEEGEITIFQIVGKIKKDDFLKIRKNLTFN